MSKVGRGRAPQTEGRAETDAQAAMRGSRAAGREKAGRSERGRPCGCAPKGTERLTRQYVFQHGRNGGPVRRKQGQPAALPISELIECEGCLGGHQGLAGAGELYWEGVRHDVQVVAVSK